MQTNDDHSERRRAERFLISLPVETDRGPGVTRDISVSGIFMFTEQRLANDQRLQIVMTLPDHDRDHTVRLGFNGTVIRVEEVGRALGVGIALDDGRLSLLPTV